MTNDKRPLRIEPVKWTIMHPTLGGSIDVVSFDAFTALKADADKIADALEEIIGPGREHYRFSEQTIEAVKAYWAKWGKK